MPTPETAELIDAAEHRLDEWLHYQPVEWSSAMNNVHPVSTASVAVLLATFLGPPVLGQATESADPTPLITRSKVWFATDIPSMDLRRGPTGPGAFEPDSTLTCDYLDKKLSGASPKFACRLPDGDELKVKYGGANGEVYGEVAASRLLWALGFGVDLVVAGEAFARTRRGSRAIDSGPRLPYVVASPLMRTGRIIVPLA